MAATYMQLLGYETKTTYDDLKVALSYWPQIFIFIANMYDSVIRQAENDLDAVLHFFCNTGC